MSWVRAIAVDQLGFYWDYSLWPRLRGLTDEEYYWEPVAGCWSVRPDADGRFVSDGSGPGSDPDPPPVTTLAWRIAHIAVGVFHTRASTFFGDGSVPADADMFDPRHQPQSLPPTAAGAVDLLRSSYEWWRDGLCRSTRRRSPARWARVGRISPSIRWLSSRCTSTARPCTTAARSACSATSTTPPAPATVMTICP